MSAHSATAARAPGAQEEFARDVTAGLARPVKAISAKYLYDEAGSALFDRICATPEYYPTRTEEGILRARATEIAALTGQNATLVEFGSGTSKKTRILLDTLGELHCYVPIDVAGDFLAASCTALRAQYPRLRVVPVCADYMQLAALPHAARLPAPLLGFFPGSTIGNLMPGEALQFLRNAAALLGGKGNFLVGVDTVKSQAQLDAAYNDAQGVTAQFSLNLLARINRELDGDFERDHFRHVAFFNPAASRIEIYLESQRAQQVRVAGKSFAFARGERIHTEYSYKYSVDSFQRLARASGWQAAQAWTDAEGLFSVHLLQLA